MGGPKDLPPVGGYCVSLGGKEKANSTANAWLTASKHLLMSQGQKNREPKIASPLFLPGSTR